MNELSNTNVDIFQTYVSFGVQALSQIKDMEPFRGTEFREEALRLQSEGRRFEVQRGTLNKNTRWHYEPCLSFDGKPPTLYRLLPDLSGIAVEEVIVEARHTLCATRCHAAIKDGVVCPFDSCDYVDRVRQPTLMPWSRIEDVPLVCWIRHKDYLHERCQLITKLSEYGPLKPDVSWAFLFSNYEWSDSPRGPWKVCGK